MIARAYDVCGAEIILDTSTILDPCDNDPIWKYLPI